MIKFIIVMIFLLTACSNKIPPMSPNEILLSIKDYSCKLDITCFSNKNITNYAAYQEYSSTGIYSMEFLDDENFKISYNKNLLSISSLPLDISSSISNYPELNSNPLFLSYFINTYFNLENPDKLTISENKISMILPENNSYLYSATLTFQNNNPTSLTYFDKNGCQKINIIYNEFKSSKS